VTFVYAQKPDHTWFWCLITEKLGNLKAKSTRDFPTKSECIADIKRVLEGIATADLQEGFLSGSEKNPGI